MEYQADARDLMIPELADRKSPAAYGVDPQPLQDRRIVRSIGATGALVAACVGFAIGYYLTGTAAGFKAAFVCAVTFLICYTELQDDEA